MPQSAREAVAGVLMPGARGRLTPIEEPMPSFQARYRVVAVLRAFVLFLAVPVASCSGPGEDGSAEAPAGRLAQAITDTDGDGMDDAWETTYFGNLSQTASGDYDSDGMTNLEEYTNGFDPTNASDAFDDTDGDRYPNVFEVRRGSNPNSASSVPTPNYTVDATGAGTHTSFSAALSAANTTNGAYQIIGIAPGTYPGSSNLNNLNIDTTKPKLLIIGLQGAAKTILDGGSSMYGWNLYNAGVVSSLTIQNTWNALYVKAPSKDVRLVDLVLRTNTGSSTYAGGIHVETTSTSSKVTIVGSTLLDNTGFSTAAQVYAGAGTVAMSNTVVWATTATSTMLAKNSSATLTTNNCLVKGQTLTGTGNLAGTTDPKVGSDGHISWDSPLRAAGGSVAQSRVDMDGEARPSTSPDIGADEFLDSDGDQLADRWELATAGNLTTLTGRTQDADGDGLTNEQELAAGTNPTVADTDSDGLSDGVEGTNGTNPLVADTDGDDMPDGWEVAHGLSPTTANGFDDADGDRYPNVFEYARGSAPDDASSIPTPNYTVDVGGGGTHTTVSAAINAASTTNGAYQIIGIAPGVYTGTANGDDVNLTATKPKLLIIGLQGASKTFIEGTSSIDGWDVYNAAVISSLTFRSGRYAVYINSPSGEVRVVDVLSRGGTSGTYAHGVHVYAGSKVKIIGSTFFDNTSNTSTTNQIYIGSGTGELTNTAVWTQSSSVALLAKAASATLVTNYSYVKGQTLTGTGNLAGTTDPKLTAISDGHIPWDSPLRNAGGSVAQSRVDMDGDPRPTSAPDIGVDQFYDTDLDNLPDPWELANAGNLTTLTGRTQDADGDGLTNDQELALGTNPTLADTDGDGLSDSAEGANGTNPLVADTDGDDMPDGWEVAYGLSPTVANGYEDADGDRYPNVFEYAASTDPSNGSSIPTAPYVVNAAGGGTHTDLQSAVNAASSASGTYKIIGIAPGTYTGPGNIRNFSLASSSKKFLIIGLQGAAQTILDAQAGFGWNVYSSAVISSLTFKNATTAVWISAPSKEVRLVDLLVRDNSNAGSTYAAGLHVDSAAAANVYVTGSTFLDNTGMSTAKAIYAGAGTTTMTNTVVWGSATGTLLAKGGSATLNTNYCLVKGQTLTGTGNLAGTVDPKIQADAHIPWDSPLRGAGGSVAQSRIDIDGDPRPTSAPDIGVDQFYDTDADNLPDPWEIAQAGNLTTLTGRTQDADGDGLTNEQELAAGTNPTVADTDGDGLSDSAEGANGTNPLVADSDGDDMPDGWEVAHGLSPTIANGFDDADGDRYPNVFEYARGSAPDDASSIPTPNYTVDASGGGTHTTVSAAVGAAAGTNAYQIIGIAPGVYTGGANNDQVNLQSTKPLLLIGLQGAAKTIIEGTSSIDGWDVYGGAVISSLTFRGGHYAISINAPSSEVRVVDVLARGGTSTTYAHGVHVQAASKVKIIGSTFFDNTGTTSTTNQIYVGSGTTELTNTAVWAQYFSAPLLAQAAGATLVTSYSFVFGQTLAGTGNLPALTDPKFLSDGHISWDSPLRGVGGAVAQSRIDMDGDPRPTSTPDIGVDQFYDTDLDNLPDPWEIAQAGNLTTLTGRTQDADGDGLTNEAELTAGTNPTSVDTDGDGLSDGDELNTYATNPTKADTDGDDMPDGWELAHGLSPLVANGFEDADGDRYPNVFEYARGTDPNDASSVPTPNYTVDGAGGGTHTTISAAIDAADVANGAYQIIGIAPGVYTGSSNTDAVNLYSTKPKLLMIGLQGAAKTIIDGNANLEGWDIYNAAVVASLTFRNAQYALYLNAPSSEVRVVDVLVRNCNGPDYATGVHVDGASKLAIVGSTFVETTGNTGVTSQIWIGSGTATLTNTVVWGKASSVPTLAQATGTTITADHSSARGQTLTGTGNLAGTLDPKVRSDGRLRSDSPLRAAGGSVVQSHFDMDGELRPTTAPDIGVDQFADPDADGLPDGWEITNYGSASAISGTADDDGDGLTNVEEYDAETDPLNADTDGDHVPDGVEVASGTNPTRPDSDELRSDVNQDGVLDSIDLQLGYSLASTDVDGDGVSNASEQAMCTDVLRADTDGDGVPDSADAFPYDPLLSSLPVDSTDVTPPQITLTAPWYAVEQ